MGRGRQKIVAGVNDLASQRPDLLPFLSPKNTIDPTTVGVGSSKKMIWVGLCGHEWEAPIIKRASGRGCPICRGLVVLKGFNDLASNFPNLVKEWSPKNVKAPDEVVKSSRTKVLWECSQGHEWEASINARARANGPGCPICVNQTVLPNINDLASTHPELYKEFDKEKNDGHALTTYGSSKKLWWKDRFGHEWEATAKSRLRSGKGCPVCSNLIVLSGFNDLASCDPRLADEWSPSNNIKPNEVLYGGSTKYLWVCSEGHEWESTVWNRRLGRGCPKCAQSSTTSKGEQELFNYFASTNLTAVANDRKVLGGLEIDVWLPELRVGFEYNGNYWHGGDEAQARDQLKRDKARSLGVRLLTIWDDDWRINADSELEFVDQVVHDLPLPRNLLSLERHLKNVLGFRPDIDYTVEPNGMILVPAHNFAVRLVSESECLTTSYALSDEQRALEAKGITLLTILPWHDWRKALEMVSHRLQQSQRVYARNTKVQYAPTRELTRAKRKELELLLESWHLLGFNSRSTSAYTWLTLNDEIVGIAAWGDKRNFTLNSTKIKSNTKELIRLVFRPGISVAGGASRLLKEYTRSVKCNVIETFSDNDLSGGQIYSTLGFTLVENSKRQKNYVNFAHLKSDGRPWRIKHTSLVMAGADRLLKNFPGYTPVGMDCRCEDAFHPKAECLPSNVEILKNYGFIEVFDCGYKKWEYTVPTERQA